MYFRVGAATIDGYFSTLPPFSGSKWSPNLFSTNPVFLKFVGGHPGTVIGL